MTQAAPLITSPKRIRKMLRRRMKLEQMMQLVKAGEVTVADFEEFLKKVSKNPTAWGVSEQGAGSLEAYAHELRTKYKDVPPDKRNKVKLPPPLQTAIRGAIIQARKRGKAGHHVE